MGNRASSVNYSMVDGDHGEVGNESNLGGLGATYPSQLHSDDAAGGGARGRRSARRLGSDMTVSSSMAVTAQQPEWQQMTRVQAVIGSGSRSQSPCTAHFWCAVSQPEATRSSRVFSFFLDFFLGFRLPSRVGGIRTSATPTAGSPLPLWGDTNALSFLGAARVTAPGDLSLTGI